MSGEIYFADPWVIAYAYAYEGGVLRAYPNNPAALRAVRAQAK